MKFTKINPLALLLAGSISIAGAIPVGTVQAAEPNTKNIELILDASGSMNGKLASGVRKIAAAKKAVESLIGKLPQDINLSFRAYGHQSHRSKNDCKDTALMVPFGGLSSVGGQVVQTSNGLTAQGYTPISYVLGLAADDLKPLTGSKTIVLVSDGKETCEGDPCLLAKKLAEANADLTIHTVGFGVDFQTKTQLQCIANVARGKYFDANSSDELANSMEKATTAEVVEPKTETIIIKIAKPKFGHLKVENGQYHKILDAETGEKVETATNSNKHLVKVKPGIYHVEFGDDLLWKSVQVIGDETTTISAGILKINKNQYHHIKDPETGKNYTTYSSSNKELALPPGTYDISFDKALWKQVTITEGETTTLDPAILKIDNNQYHRIHAANGGGALMTYSSSTKYLAVPPGDYNVSFDKAIWENVELKAGVETVLKPAVLKINNQEYHEILPIGGKKSVMTYSSSTKFLAVPPGDYSIKFHDTIWNVKLEEGKETTLNPGGLKITPRGYYDIFQAGSDKKAGTHSSSSKKVMLVSGDYYVKIGEQDVPFTITEGKIIELKIE